MYVVSAIAAISTVVSTAHAAVGDLYEADFGSGEIFKFTPAGARTTFATGLNSPAGLAFDAGGNLFVANNTANSITKITPSGVKSTFASGLNLPYGLGFDHSGNLYEADEGSGNIFKFTPTGARSTFATGLSSPAGLAFDALGNLFVGNFTAGRIDKIAPNGARTLLPWDYLSRTACTSHHRVICSSVTREAATCIHSQRLVRELLWPAAFFRILVLLLTPLAMFTSVRMRLET